MALYKHAAILNLNFAKAHVSRSRSRPGHSEQPELAAEHAAKAFALKARVTEREKFEIARTRHATAHGDLLKAIWQALELWRQTYTRDQSPRNRLAPHDARSANSTSPIPPAREAHQINPRTYAAHVSLGTVLAQLNRFDEAEAIIEQGLAQQIGTTMSHCDLFLIASVRDATRDLDETGDRVGAGRSDRVSGASLGAGSTAATFAGRLQRAATSPSKPLALAGQSDPERTAGFAEEAVLRDAICGSCRSAKNAGPVP